jgi:hypothetical protein
MSQPSTRPLLHKGYRFPPEIISRCVWLYDRFGVSLCDVFELMLARGFEVSHETIRLWTLRFGTEYARLLRRRRGPCSNIWHLDELCLMIKASYAAAKAVVMPTVSHCPRLAPEQPRRKLPPTRTPAGARFAAVQEPAARRPLLFPVQYGLQPVSARPRIGDSHD